MPISEYLRNLRTKIGHDMVLTPSVSAVILNAAGEILLQRTKDYAGWLLVGGAVDPGEEPADAIIREVREETSLHVVAERIVAILANPPFRYPNGDVVRYVQIGFLCRPISGEPRVNDDESLELRYFSPQDLPTLLPPDRTCVAQALNGQSAAYFRVSSIHSPKEVR
jgi:8-oxo-dGTP pyrophosphatase MutT (NUDIX family)